MEKDQPKAKPGGLSRFFNAFSSLNPGEVTSELLQEYALLRRIVFALLVIAAFIWGSWNAVMLMLGIWALYEGMAYLTKLLRGGRN